MKILITGGAGFVAKYLAQALKTDEVLLVDVVEDKNSKIKKLDITKKNEVDSLINSFRPDQIYHLAAISSPRIAPIDIIYEVNVQGTCNILSAVKKYAPGCKILLVSSGYVYGNCIKPTSENSKLKPIGAYGESKVEMETMAKNNFSDLNFIIARPFNHTGKGQKLGFVLPDLANQINLIKQGKSDSINTFNLSDKRDFLHVADVVKAYVLLMKSGRLHEIYNISSGISTSIGEILRRMIAKSDLTNVAINEQKSASLLKNSCGSSLKIKTLGWTPKYSLDDIVSEFIN